MNIVVYRYLCNKFERMTKPLEKVADQKKHKGFRRETFKKDYTPISSYEENKRSVSGNFYN